MFSYTFILSRKLLKKDLVDFLIPDAQLQNASLQ